MPYSDDVNFDTDQGLPMSTGVGIVQAENKMAEWLMRRGIAKNKNQAQYILLGIAIGAVIIGVGVWFVLIPSAPAAVTPQQLQQLSKMTSGGAAAPSTPHF